MEMRDTRGRAEQGANLWGPGEILQETMERKGRERLRNLIATKACYKSK